MRLAGSSLLYSRLSLGDACDRLAGLGFERVDLGAMEGWAHVNPSAIPGAVDATAERIATACDAADLTPVAFNANAGTDDPEVERERVRALAAVADALDVPVITLQAADPDTSLDADLDRFRRLVDAVDGYDASLTVETHWGTHLEDPAVAERYGAIEGLGLTLDPAHYAIGPHRGAGYDDLLSHVRHVHARQAGDGWENVQRPPDDGWIDFDALLAELRAAGYDGAVSVEYIDSLDGVDPDDAEAHAAAMLDRLRDHLG